jgi:ligand-binding SRPBCC domain-containing protein
MRLFEFRAQLWLKRPRPEVFSFFADAQNLEQITPPWLRFRVVSELPSEIHQGAEIEYRLKIRGIPARWRSRITAWEPPQRFVDEQLHGPYRVWIHEHRFSESNGGTLCEDFVRYAPPGGVLINELLVKRDIKKIFAYRSQALRKILEGGDNVNS